MAILRSCSNSLASLLVLALLAFPAIAQDAAKGGAMSKAGDAQAAKLTVFAAASMKDALDAANAAYTAKTGTQFAVSYGSSATLAKQLEQAAPADLFISADIDSMNLAVDKGAMNAATRIDLLGNRLVLIAPKDSRIDNVTIGNGFDLAKLAGDGRIATGDVASVPVGKYAKAALERLGSWNAASSKFAMADNVRAALTLVARGEAVLGIVYSTDAKVEPGVKVVGTFPEDSHPPITYPVAATKTANPATAAYLAYLRSPEARAIFERFGFSVLAKPPAT